MTEPSSSTNVSTGTTSTSSAQEKAAFTYLLSNVVHPLRADIGTIYYYCPHAKQFNLEAVYSPHNYDAAILDAFHVALMQLLDGLLPTTRADHHELSHDVFDSALIYPLRQPNHDIVGALVLAAGDSETWDRADLAQLDTPALLAQTLLRQRLFNQHMVRMQTLTQTLDRLNTAATPQHAIDLIADHDESLHIAFGAILMFGPVSILDYPKGPFDYLEVKGVWPKRNGKRLDQYVRIALDVVPDELFEKLSAGQPILLDNQQAEEDIPALMDMLVIPDAMRTIALFPLATTAHRLGILILVTAPSYYLTQNDSERLETVSRFYSNVLLNYVILEQQTFLIHGRAILLDAVSDGILIQVLYQGSPHVMMFNQAFANMFGVDADHLIPTQTLLDKMQIAQHVRRELQQLWVKTDMRSPQMAHGQFDMTSLKGAPATIEWHSTPFYQDGQVVARLLTLHDVSPEYVADNLRKELLSRVSHELRTPLTSISGFAEMILDLYGTELPQAAQEYASHILSNARHLRDVVNDIIQVTRADAGLLSLSLVHVQISEIAKNLAASMDVLCQPRGITIHFQFQPKMPAIYVDVERLTQVLRHLMLNAIQYSPPNGNIIIMARLVEDMTALPKSAPEPVIVPCVLVGIHDEGQGITEEDVNNVFLPFYRTETARRERIQGAGLGLAVARSFIEIHRGQIWAEVHPGKQAGGHFLFTLPVTLP